jgi:cytoskeletal protein RodZ
MKKYYLHNGQVESGPFDFEQLKEMQLNSDTLIWYDGLSEWTKIKNIEDLKSIYIPKPPPLKPPVIETKEEEPIIQRPTYIKETTKSKSYKLPLIILGSLAVLGIIGWLIFQNGSQENIIKQVKEKVNQQEQAISNTQSEQNSRNLEEQQRQQEEEQKKQEKDRINAELTQKYMGYRNNWNSYISASNNRYTYSEMGGISNLEVIVSNSTDKKIDEVQVRVDYIKTNGGTFKSETVSVSNISPNSTKSVTAPTSERGTSVKMNIESVSASAFHFCYPYGNSDNDADPYFCK